MTKTKSPVSLVTVVDTPTANKLRKLAKDNNRSVAGELRVMIDKYLKEQK